MTLNVGERLKALEADVALLRVREDIGTKAAAEALKVMGVAERGDADLFLAIAAAAVALVHEGPDPRRDVLLREIDHMLALRPDSPKLLALREAIDQHGSDPKAAAHVLRLAWSRDEDKDAT